MVFAQIADKMSAHLLPHKQHSRQSKLFVLETRHKYEGAQEHCLQLLIWHYFRKITSSLITNIGNMAFWVCARMRHSTMYVYLPCGYICFWFSRLWTSQFFFRFVHFMTKEKGRGNERFDR